MNICFWCAIMNNNIGFWHAVMLFPSLMCGCELMSFRCDKNAWLLEIMRVSVKVHAVFVWM